MGEYNVHFDTFDSLNYLIPPVKKSNGTLETDLLFSRDFKRQTDIRFKDFRKKIPRQLIRSPSHESDVQTSPSVILKKTTEELIHEQYSFVHSNNRNYNNTKYLLLNKEGGKKCTIEDKPMIKVTVIPKAADNQTSKVFNKRCERNKNLHSTVSNLESSVKSQNIYFMVKGKRREKVYEIKSTESTNLSNKLFNTKYEDISIQQITNSKQLISSLNMEKNKRKNKKRELKNPKISNFSDTGQNIKNFEESEGVNARKSKVTIVGQLGLNHDDQYVLKCAATVNNKPIATNYVQLDHIMNRNLLNINRNVQGFTSKFRPTEFSINDDDDHRTRGKDSNIQTDICYTNTCINLAPNREEHRNTSQTTQVNFGQPRHKKPTKGSKNKEAQCNFEISTIEKNAINGGVQDNDLKDCKSPLIIISVYPRQYDKEHIIMNSPVKITQPLTSPRKISNNSDYTKAKAHKGQRKDNNTVSVNKSELKSARSRSPSPGTKTVPNNTLINKTGNQVLRNNNNTNNVSSQRLQSNRNKISGNKSKHRLNDLKKDVSCYCPYSIGLGNQEFIRHQVNSKVRDIKETDKRQVKRALVNSFLRNVSRIDQNDSKIKLFVPKEDTSRIAININGDKERYDVLLEQCNFNTSLSARKTLKKQSQTNNTADEVDRNAMENYLMLSEEIKNTPTYSREMREISKPKESRINIRDSLEICHSRGGRANSRPDPTPIRGKDDTFFISDFMAPVKHYRGDDCSILDPNERDKEIRELLGIVRNTRNSKKVENVSTKDHKDFYSHHDNQREKDCCCSKKRTTKELKTGLSISKLAKKCLRKKKSTYQGISIASRLLLKKREAKKKERGTQASQKNKEVCMEAPETSSSTQSVKLSSEDERCLPDKCIQENFNFSNEIPFKESVIQRNLTLNRNVQVFLQIKQFTKQKPINLTKKQYEKVKRTIQGTINQRKFNLNNFNIVSVGEIKVKPKLQHSRYDREVQTEVSEIQRTVRCIQIQTQYNNYYKSKKKEIQDSEQNECNQGQVNKIISTVDKKDYRMNSAADGNNDRTVSSANRNNNRIISSADRNNDKVSSSADTEKDENKNKHVTEKHVKSHAVTPRQTVSSMEIHYANVAYMKKVTLSSTHFGDGLYNKMNTNDNKPTHSLHTIFKGHRKSATPNLGTSAYSLCSDANDSTKPIKAPLYAGDCKPKKPFLQRLLSCLVMRSTETTVLKQVPKQNQPSLNSSVDSYHISTSLGALEMTSTLYDTSASFYSNHTIAPTNKMKRGGFFTSVRGFLTTRRS